jgi:hypothetical protein
MAIEVVPTREQYIEQRRRWVEADRLQREQRDALAELTHKMLDTYSAADLASWLDEEGDDLGAHGVRHWDVRWHKATKTPRQHATVKPA